MNSKLLWIISMIRSKIIFAECEYEHEEIEFLGDTI